MNEEKKKRPQYKGHRVVSEETLKEARLALAKRREAAAKNAAAAPEQTNAYIATHNTDFMEACERAGTPPTTRQASKFKRKRGLAWSAYLTMQNERKQAAEK